MIVMIFRISLWVFVQSDQVLSSQASLATTLLPSSSINRQQQFHVQMVDKKLRLLQEDQERRQENEEAFKGLREGLNNFPATPRERQRLRKAPESSELVNHLNMENDVRAQAPSQSPGISQEELLREAGLIDQEEVLLAPQSPKVSDSSLQKALYIIISTIIAVYVVKRVREWCLRGRATIQAHHEEAESLANM